jgi:hypothetical protein
VGGLYRQALPECYHGEYKANMRDEIDGTEECKVSLRDAAGIEHTVNVRAINRYHAFGLALAKMKQCSWSNPEHRDLNRMGVELIQTGKKWRRVYVTAAQFEAWLAQRDSTAQKHRDYVKMLLGRIPPDREFKKGNRR